MSTNRSIQIKERAEVNKYKQLGTEVAVDLADGDAAGRREARHRRDRRGGD